MTYEEAYLYMKEAGKRGSVYGTETVKELLLRLGNPQDRVPVVHIAGTNHVSVPNISSVYPRHTICQRWTYHPKARSFSSETSGLFVKNIRAFRQNRDFPSKCPPFRLLKWRIKSAKHWFRRVDPKVWQMKWRKNTTKKEKRCLSFYANLKLNLN